MTHPRKGDIHRVENAHADRTSISAPLDGTNIGAVERVIFRQTSQLLRTKGEDCAEIYLHPIRSPMSRGSWT